MPKVIKRVKKKGGGTKKVVKHYPYTQKGRKAATKARKRSSY